jgi:hypothetical protein
VCRYGANGVCSSLPVEGVSDKDYEDHVLKHHVYQALSQPKKSECNLLLKFFYCLPILCFYLKNRKMHLPTIQNRGFLDYHLGLLRSTTKNYGIFSCPLKISQLCSMILIEENRCIKTLLIQPLYLQTWHIFSA